ncbi:hypothetical protein ES319_D10G049800v1 [Gossypium barbadense]|uniref:Uncharacterized protein n=1 Tax=Gossypium barbadense TaxID=3634 RepID=A0A5J5PMU5_GOSBA|nr:hypothetical protein ES319_D10G049800v1 [Gossypium barbadense]
MASSLHQLLKEEGFEKGKLLKNQPDDSTALPIYICRGRKSSEITEHKDEKTVIRNGSSLFSSFKPKSDEPVIDEAAIKAVISILGGYTGRYLKDESYRAMVKDKCTSCLLSRRKAGSDGGIFMNMELGIESIDKLVEDRGNKKELRMKLLRNSIRLLSIVASLNCEKSRNGSTCGVPHSHLSACAQLYLSIVYKLEKNHRLSARHLLQVFCDSAFLARTHLLPDLWDHFFLPHLLHLKVWYHKELEHLSNLGNALKETQMKASSKLYNDQMDMGTAMFAMYYKEWLKIGAKVPPVPTVPLPSSSSYGSSRRRSSESHASVSSINRNLYQTVFGAATEWQSMELNRRIRTSIDICRLEAEENEFKYENYNQNKKKTHRRSSSSHIYSTPRTELLPETQKSGHFRFFSCQSRPKGCLVNGKIDVRNNSMINLEHLSPTIPFAPQEIIDVRRTQMMKFLNELLRGWGGLNTMHILLACLHKALPEERPLVAALLLQLDLLGDPFRCSVYREEAVEVIIETLDCEKCNDKIQQQSAKALTMLGGRFSYMGEATTESWLLKQAGFHENLEDSFQKKEIGDNFLDEGEEEIENWQKKAAIALLNSGNKRFLAALSNSMAKDIPSLARASLVTIAWMSCFLHLAGDKDFQAMASSILTPRLLESLNSNRVLEERVLATFSLQQIRKSSEYIA